MLAAVLGLLLSACSDGHQEVRALPGAGWPMYGGDNANANYTPLTAANGLALSWSRETGGPITTPVTLNPHGELGVTAATEAGCNLFIFGRTGGRKNWCKKMAAGVTRNAPSFDQNSQPFIGESSMLLAFNGGGNIRWRMPVIGLPVSVKFAGPGGVLMVTNQGQILLLDAQTNVFRAPEVRLWPDADPEQPLAGIAECTTGGPGCAVSAPPAVDESRERFYLNFVPPGASAARLTAMSYGRPDAPSDFAHEISQRWQVEVPGGMMGPPALSADGGTVYAFGRDGRLHAFDADDGTERWNHDLGGFGFATLTVSPDGVIIPAGGIGAPLTILRDHGDRVEVRALRRDLKTVSLATQTGADTAWTVVRTGGAADPLDLIEVSTTDGATKRTLRLPGATGFTTGVAVSQYGDLAVAANNGEVFYFSPR
ncbi:hypothetical protein GOHSU_04_00460 [Gordonia hirsuta DSM 44140 = NBRC 16056]|uniref:Pyrrolo-quinoline quinone repeat domain-containing protein n=1 Tax=Gordonia hirsuta DSM 44140 = NBRC 16056 TaxID=1121927 RepID=L7L7Z9_9ACTN|nr:hypothetical protein GOHSU_04_00460 [Gordonia hirsuta DSM 44140 = NBRC 16056]